MQPLVLALLPAMALAAESLPPGWFLAGHEGDFTATTLDRGCDQLRAIRLASREPAASTYGTAMQLFRADPYRGQRLRFSAILSTTEVKGWVGLWMRVDGADAHHSLAFDNMQDRPLSGTAGCAQVSVVLDVPPDAVTVAAGVVLEGAGQVELSSPRFEPVPPSVASTDLLGRKLKLGAPGPNPEEKPNELDESLGRVGAVWFNDFGIQSGRRLVMHRRNPSRWSDATGDNLVTVEGDRLDVKLTATTGVFRFGHDGEALVITGDWGWPVSYPVSIRLTHQQLDMAWGMYERHLAREDAAQVAPGCVRFAAHLGTVMRATDFLYVCGQVLEPTAPPVQTLVAFLANGFRRTPLANDLGAQPRRATWPP
jgi:hypothetical protein